MLMPCSRPKLPKKYPKFKKPKVEELPKFGKPTVPKTPFWRF